MLLPPCRLGKVGKGGVGGELEAMKPKAKLYLPELEASSF
jgi:hypothetical protein